MNCRLRTILNQKEPLPMISLAEYIKTHNLPALSVWRRHRVIKKLLETTLAQSTTDAQRSDLAAAEVIAQFEQVAKEVSR